ncbi:MAG: AMP-binding protein [Deltaproteobacteria bacterium]|nr:AMP-binding protein [Deltaproteobacteria bacterium]
MHKNFSYWPKGVSRTLRYPEVPIFQIIRSSARKWPNRNALIFAGMEMTFAELDQLSDRFATALCDLGVTKGDRIALHLPNSPQFAIAYYGLLKAGAVFVPVSLLLAEREITFQLNDSGAETFIGVDLFYPLAKESFPKTGVKNVILTSLADCYPPVNAPVKMLSKSPFEEGVIDFISLLKEYPAEPPDLSFDVKEDLAHISYTGGTTGTPKGVMVTHYNGVVASCQLQYWFTGGDISYRDGVFGIEREDGDRPEDHVVRPGMEMSIVVPPWFHAMGTFAFLNMQLLAGATLIVIPRFDPKDFLEAIPKYRVTIFGGAPQLFVPMVEHPLYSEIDMSDIRLVASGAAPISPGLLEAMQTKIPGAVTEAYGLSEATVAASFGIAEKDKHRMGSVGLPIQDTEIKIVDVDDYTKEMPVGETGEVCVRGPQVMMGYWKKPEETANVIKEGGWLLTGDMGRFDEDGFLFIVDRKKDMLIYKGYNVYPRDLEEVLNAHSKVAQSAVVGKHDDRYGDLPVAFVQLVGGEEISEEELMEYANAKLAKYKKLRVVKIIDQIPVSGVGKILKRELRPIVDELEIEM